MGNGTQNKNGYTAEEYLEGERTVGYRSEYYFGEVFARAGATQTHNLITGNVFTFLFMPQNAHHVQGYERKDGEWKYSVVEGLVGQVHLPQLGVSLSMSDIYEAVLLEPQPFWN